MTHRVDKVKAQGFFFFTWSQIQQEILLTPSWRYVSKNVYIQHIRRTSGKPVNANDVTIKWQINLNIIKSTRTHPLPKFQLIKHWSNHSICYSTATFSQEFGQKNKKNTLIE